MVSRRYVGNGVSLFALGTWILDSRGCRQMGLALLGLLLLPCTLSAAPPSKPAGKAAAKQQSPLILAHYMPWFQSKPVSGAWGWHWTMNAFDPDRVENGRPTLASHFTPLIGPYDSGDLAVLEYHLLTMKLAGIDGVIVDWYGLSQFRDYPELHRNTTRLIEQAERLGMQFAICYEDQAIPSLVEAGKLKAEQRVEQARRDLEWLAEHWWSRPGYVQLEKRPLLLSFGRDGLTDAEWEQTLAALKTPVTYLSEHHRRPAAAGAFDWPIPTEGPAAQARFHKDSREWPTAIAVAYPRFVDIYAEAKVHPSWGRIEDADGATMHKTLAAALASGAPIIQLATWNDWGEGTQFEPSVEHGFRDVQKLRDLHQQRHPQHKISNDELTLPHQLWQARQRMSNDQQRAEGDRIAQQLAEGKLSAAKGVLQKLLPTQR